MKKWVFSLNKWNFHSVKMPIIHVTIIHNLIYNLLRIYFPRDLYSSPSLLFQLVPVIPYAICQNSFSEETTQSTLKCCLTLKKWTLLTFSSLQKDTVFWYTCIHCPYDGYILWKIYLLLIVLERSLIVYDILK